MDWSAWWAAHGETVWASLAAIVITAVISFIFYRKAEKPKRLGWEVMSKSRIINASRNQRANLKVVYKDQEVASPNIVVLRIGSVGKGAIRASDLPEPIKLELHDTKLLATEIVATSNPYVKADLRVSPDDPNLVELEPALFNSDQWLEVQLVTDGALSDPLVRAQVADGEVVEIVTKDDSTELMKSSTSVIVMTAVIIVAGDFLLGQPAPSTILSWAIWVLGLLTFAGYIVFIALTIRRSRRGKYRWVDSTESLASALPTRLAKKG
jgi:hypothetical protein